MDSRAGDTVLQTDPTRLNKSIQGLAGLVAFVVNLSLLVSFWGQWRVVAVIVAVDLGLTLFNVVFLKWLARKSTPPRVDAVRLGVNAVGIALVGLHTQWPLPLWVFVPYNMLWFFGLDRWMRPRMALYLVALNGVALATGASPAMALAFSLIGIFGYAVSERRVMLLQGMLEQVQEKRAELEKAHQELQQLHQRALEQERLSSLGLMAASVAHEINNPMSFVTSNVRAMLEDLRAEQPLSGRMKEYLDEVLPDTLDGIQRVNSIVSDLRRFSRGGFEGHVEYDFDAEVRMALRIARVQLRHVRLEEEVSPVGTVVGRPRQLVQVLVNLLVNAGQATPEGGVVRLTTRPEGLTVRVEVRDTGSGMSEETKQHLFEPFFTTKPPGVGTGLGLSVVRGIIKSHGGRIEVQSELGKGTCFTLELPRVPPLQPEGTSSGELKAG
jgi:signal transduction histidine kinase